MVDIIVGVWSMMLMGMLSCWDLTQVLPLAGGPSTLLAGSHSSCRPHCKIHFLCIEHLVILVDFALVEPVVFKYEVFEGVP